VADPASLPVVYFLHGVPGTAGGLVADGLATAAAHYVATGGTPFELVVPDGNGDHHADTEWGDAADGSDMIESRLLDAVLPAVEGAHRRSPARRAIAGWSMGGYGAVNIALRHPGVFGTVGSISGYFTPNDPSHMFGSGSALAANDPENHVAGARGLDVFLAEAADEEAPIGGQARQFARMLGSQHVPVTLEVRPGHHDWPFVASVLPRLFAFLAHAWADGY
jgi:S-formylglutathione hydrolase FrmB